MSRNKSETQFNSTPTSPTRAETGELNSAVGGALEFAAKSLREAVRFAHFLAIGFVTLLSCVPSIAFLVRGSLVQLASRHHSTIDWR